MSGREVYVLDAVRTPFGRHGGALAAVRPDDLAAGVLGVSVIGREGQDTFAMDSQRRRPGPPVGATATSSP